MCERKDIVALFESAYGSQPAVVAKAPGRLEVLGNHTDYNEGVVLSAAVGQTTRFAVLPIAGTVCEIRDFRDSSVKTFDLRDIDEPEPGDWSNYVKGVVCEVRGRGKDVGAFKAAILSDIPLSAGMSSSAALEISAGFALAEAYGLNFDKTEWARIGQGVENNYLGVQTGLLDQFTSIYGEECKLIFCDFREVAVKGAVGIPDGYVFVVANSMVQHDLVDSDYNVRRESCERTVRAIKERHPEVSALRDVDSMLLDSCSDLLSNRDFRIASHVVGENERVIRALEVLKKGDARALGELLYQSHESSRVNFENSCQELDSLVELSKSIPGCLGARLSGGGFGGISIHFVEADEAETYRRRLETAFFQQTGKKTETIVCSIGAGASLV
ncbi:MAG: galactokinase [Victivallales bacterium]|nr:galactokinase [Victivallales bacterium]